MDTKIRKTRGSKTLPKPEKHAKIAKTIKQRSKNHVFFEKSCTGAQEKCSKSWIFVKNHQFRIAKIQKTIGERVKTEKIRHQIYQNRRKSFKSRKIIKKESTKFQNTISNAPKRDQILKNTQKLAKTLKQRSKNHVLFRKFMYWSPGKLLEIVDFREKSSILDSKNSKDTWRTRQNHVKIWIRSTKIVENRSKVEKSSQNNQRNSKAP